MKRSRRAVRQAGTVGGDDVNLVSVHPALPDQSATAPTPATPSGATVRNGSLDRSADDSDVGWGEREPGSNDDRLSTDKPPHW